MTRMGIVWYRSAEDYEALVSQFIDADSLPDHYEEWLLKAEALERQVRAAGIESVRAYLDPIQFPIWCSDRALDLDAKARARFGTEFSQEHWQDLGFSEM